MKKFFLLFGAGATVLALLRIFSILHTRDHERLARMAAGESLGERYRRRR
ncbi:MAG: hypothetical protein ACOYMV_12940 [Verrucomicrobiia bacterium]|jgi:hypothetical protein